MLLVQREHPPEIQPNISRIIIIIDPNPWALEHITVYPARIRIQFDALRHLPMPNSSLAAHIPKLCLQLPQLSRSAV
jgi:hypothetical protein